MRSNTQSTPQPEGGSQARPGLVATWKAWPGRKWPIAVIGLLLGGLSVLGIVFAVVTFVTLVQNGQDRQQHWAEVTGPIGDTFGGVLGPLLNALVLLTTVYIALFFQPRRADEERQEAERTRQDERRSIDQRERAAGVVGWIAETEYQRYIGVVVTNAADSVVYNVDIRVTVAHGGVAPRIDRETVLPPGSWFIPFLAPAGPVESHPDDVAEVGWKLPVPIRLADGMTVALEQSDEEGAVEFFLRPHLPKAKEKLPDGSDGGLFPHYSLAEFRYELHDKAWERLPSGEPAEARILSSDDETERKGLARQARPSAQPNTASRRVGPDVERLIQRTFEQVCNVEQLEEAQGPDVKHPLRGPFAVRDGVLPGVRSVERPTNGGRIQFNLDAPAGARLWMAQVNDQYPQTVRLEGPKGTTYLIDGKRADGQIKRAGARSRGLTNASHLERPAGEWLADEVAEKQWFDALAKMVETCARAVPTPRAAGPRRD